jgi:3-oxoacyl-[acyl-carrier protein] reductase
VQGDVSQPSQVKKVFDAVINAFGTVDILINNAGITLGKPFLETTKEDWLQVFDANFFSTVLCSQEAVKIMSQKGSGKIINTASIRGIEHTGRQGIMAYSAAKAAVINFTKTLAKEVAPNITVNAVAPGFVYTPNYEAMPKEMTNEFIEETLIKRFISDTEIAEAFIYLAGANAVTGEVLVVDGGFTLK